MRIQILSDLHLEVERQGYPEGRQLYNYDIPIQAEHLALLGDIGCTVHDQLFEWLRAQLRRFKVLFYVMGNHEPYRSSIDESQSRLAAFAAEVNAESQSSETQLGKFVFLNRTRYDVSPRLTILGCTLWSALDPKNLDVLSLALNDFRRIENFNPKSFDALHRGDLAWLNATVAEIYSTEPERDIAVLTHHAPTLAGTGHPKFDGQPTNSAFATELTGEVVWTSGRVKMWAFGHTHWVCDFQRDGVRVYSNQRGYAEGGDNYDPGKYVDLLCT